MVNPANPPTTCTSTKTVRAAGSGALHGHHPALNMAASVAGWRRLGAGDCWRLLGERWVVKAETVNLRWYPTVKLLSKASPRKAAIRGPGEWPHYYYKEGEQPYNSYGDHHAEKSDLPGIHSAHFEHNIIGAAPRWGVCSSASEVVPSTAASTCRSRRRPLALLHIAHEARRGQPVQAARDSSPTPTSNMSSSSTTTSMCSTRPRCCGRWRCGFRRTGIW
jgi:hypothetical protein